MRDGQVIERGAPRELVDRYGRSTIVRFTLPSESEAACAAERLARLPAVTGLERSGRRVALRGSRAAVAHIGAALVAAGDVPADLSVEMPTLEDALVELLEGSHQSSPGPNDQDIPYFLEELELEGARR